MNLLKDQPIYLQYTKGRAWQVEVIDLRDRTFLGRCINLDGRGQWITGDVIRWSLDHYDWKEVALVSESRFEVV